MASEVRADSEVAEDVPGIVDDGGGAGGSGEARGLDAPEASAEPGASDEAEAASTEAGPRSADEATATGVTEVAEATETTEVEPAPRKRRIAVVLLCAALALTIDIVSKAIVVAQLQDRAPVHVPGGFLILNMIRNSGAAFSIGEGQTWVFTVIAAGVVFVILRVSRNLRSLPWAVALGMLLGGALGNLSDRLFRAPGVGRGDVVDFLQFPTFPLVHYDFPVFNLADSSIVIGGCLMVLLSFLGIQPDGSRHKS